MHFALVAATVIILLVNRADLQACAAGTAREINGNWYCSQVNAITYSNFPGNGSYNEVTNMDAASGECATTKHDYSGSLSPLNEELSIHVRGPISLKQFAVYTPAGGLSKKRTSNHGRDAAAHHGHQFNHDHQGIKRIHNHGPAKRSLGQLVSATIDGQVASWTNLYQGLVPTTSTLGIQAALPSPTPPDLSSATIEPSSMAVSPVVSVTSGTWSRQAYYNANTGIAEGITFLNHFGGTDGIPGTAAGGPSFGASLSYASPDGQSGSSTPQILSNAMVEDNVEVIVVSNQSCNDGGCGYTRPGGVNYHGFAGSQKVFLFEFSMPFSNKTGFNDDMPAIWLLNAQIPLTSQYGTNPDCSCWTSGCGEFDLFEVLDQGSFRCKSTLHMAPAGGSSDWLLRPTGDSINAVVIIGGPNEVAAIRVLDQEQPFAESLGGSVIDDWLDTPGSHFDMSR